LKGESVEDPFEEAGKEFRRAMEQHARHMREEMDRAREEMRKAMNQCRADLARAEFERQMEEARAHFNPRDGGWPDWMPSRKQRRPRRKPPGGEPAPVKPRPNPKPLVDGAEAPIE
jgi:exonuclease VII small subunit